MSDPESRSRFGGRGGLAALLVVVNLALVAFNLDKHELLPVSLGLSSVSTDGLGPEAPDTTDPTTAATDPTTTTVQQEADEAEPSEVTTDVAAEVDQTVDDWPGGRGAVPDGPPVPRLAILQPDGRLELTGSAPDWATVTEIVESAGNTLPGGIDAVDNRLSWHPDASLGVQSGDVLVEQGATFALGQSVIESSSFPTLDLTAQLLNSRPSLFVVVIGHTDNLGDEDANAQLALERANAVVDYLVAAGVVPGQLVVASAGEDDPAASNDTEAGREVNRRIEFHFKNFYVDAEDFGLLEQ